MLKQAIKKAKKSNCKYKIVAIGLNRKGDIIGFSTNIPRFKRFGGSVHAEINLIHKHGSKIRNILITRVGKSGQLLPISPCKNCKKVAEKMGIKINFIGGE